MNCGNPCRHGFAFERASIGRPDIVINLANGADRGVVFYNQRGTAKQCNKEGNNAVKWTRLSCRTMLGNAVRRQLYALAYNLANFLRTLALPLEVQHWSLTSICNRLVEIGAKAGQPCPLCHLSDG